MENDRDDLRDKILRDIEEAGRTADEQSAGGEREPDVDDDGFRSEATVGPVSEERANRFYDKLRTRIKEYVDSKGETLGKAAEFLLLAPDVFILLWRLVQDSRVRTNDKMLLGTGIAYYIFPIDLFPEAFVGPTGYVEDLILGALILAKLLKDTPAEVLEEHWSGNGNVLEMIRNVLESAENLVARDVLERIRRMVK
jgi:uncharacterized membrane protein YkvA (DUF1232 family)